ncbi:CFEM domain-containing protein [Colletotrichum sojae]|uniref:CFEM domain-containing protein n=1 Tax=Colletotrichum sojae TaxID=2175907 RepID=A0A8H6MVU3_9PEZI|nr:CFEM domain-containing protein [Colletotrichum sojae]
MRHAYLGVHLSNISQDRDIRLGSFWNYIGQILYNPMLAIVKSSVLLFMLRLSGHKRGVRLTIHALNMFNVTLGIAIFVVVIFQCAPIAFFWDKTIPGGRCIKGTTFYAITAGLTILTDILVLAFPFWIFIGLQMARRVKAALIAVFLLGGVVTVVSCFRLAWIVERALPGRAPRPDPTYDIRFTYSFAETGLAIVAASAPAMRYLFRIWFPGVFSVSGASSAWRSRYGDASEAQGTAARRTIPLKDMASRRTTIRSQSPTCSEEAIISYDGILRKTETDDVQVDGDSRTERSS